MNDSKFIEDFEEWIIKENYCVRNKHGVLMHNTVSFYSLPFSFKWGVYTDFFDSVGIQIEDEAFWRYDTRIYNWRIFGFSAGEVYRGLEYNNRKESRVDAFIEATKIYDNKQKTTNE